MNSGRRSGAWRPATKAEGKNQGGDLVVLLNAKGDRDWIVYQDRESTLKGDAIILAQLNYRTIKEHGRRG